MATEIEHMYKVQAYSHGSWEFGIIRASSKEEAYITAKKIFERCTIYIDEVEFEENYCYISNIG